MTPDRFSAGSLTTGSLSTGVGTTAARFRFGLVAGVLVGSSVNALSYFCRGGGWGDLLGTRQSIYQAIGFPLAIWQAGERAGVNYVDYTALAGDVAIALAFSLVSGVVAIFCGKGAIETIDRPPPADRRFQSSLRTLLLLMSISAVAAAIGGSLRGVGTLLLTAIYLLGPTIILGVAHWSRRIVPWQRFTLVTVTAVALVAVAAASGQWLTELQDFTRALLGVFICWIPQCALFALILRYLPLGNRPPVTQREP